VYQLIEGQIYSSIPLLSPHTKLGQKAIVMIMVME